MSLEDVIKNAIDEAREDGLEGAQVGEEPDDVIADDVARLDTEETDEAIVEDKTGDESEEDGDKEAKGDDKADEDTETTEEPPVVEKKDEKAEKAAPKSLAEELKLKPRADGREHRIPLSRVETMVTKAREETATLGKTVVETLGKALGVPEAEIGAATFETLAPKLTEALGEVEELRDRVSIMDDLAPIMLRDGNTFIKMLAAKNPEQYAKFLAVLEDGFEAPERRELPEEKDDPRPEADLTIKLPDGTVGKTYSVEGAKKLEEWQERKSERKFNATLDKRFKPLDEAEKAKQSSEARQERLVNDMNEFMSEAHEWRGFKDHKDAILAAVKLIDKKVSFRKAVRMAYENVYFEKHHADRTKMRTEILAELKKAPVKTGVGSKGAVKAKTDEVVRGEGGEVVTGSEAAIRRAVAKAKAAGMGR